MPDAGGLIIAPSIEVAKYIAELIEIVDEEPPIQVHSQTANAEKRIEAFKKTTKRWLVSVAMISEGVDIPRLRVLVYLPNALTELAFRQAIGRVVRTNGPNDDTRAYVVMPSFDILEEYARRVEDEMSPSARRDDGPPKTKKCPSCSAELGLGEKLCSSCGYEFPERATKFKSCDKCNALNPISAEHCQQCGSSFLMDFVLSLDEALRTGAIVRGLDLEETEVQEGENLAELSEKGYSQTGDAKLIQANSSLARRNLGQIKNNSK